MQGLVNLLGLICGFAGTAAILLGGSLQLLDPDVSLPLEEPAQLVVASAAGRGVPATPLGALGLSGPESRGYSDLALRHARVEVARLESTETGAAALAVKLSTVSADNSLLRGELAMHSTWNLAWPGHGSLFLMARDDYRPLLADQVANALRGEGFRASARAREITRGARLLGGGGQLQQAVGTYREFLDPEAGRELELGLKTD